MIRRCDFLVFYRLDEARKIYLEGDIANLTRLKNSLSSDNKNEEIMPAFWKKIFEFIDIPTV